MKTLDYSVSIEKANGGRLKRISHMGDELYLQATCGEPLAVRVANLRLLPVVARVYLGGVLVESRHIDPVRESVVRHGTIARGEFRCPDLSAISTIVVEISSEDSSDATIFYAMLVPKHVSPEQAASGLHASRETQAP